MTKGNIDGNINPVVIIIINNAVGLGARKIPLTMLSRGRDATIIACRAEDSTKKFLEALGIIPGVS